MKNDNINRREFIKGSAAVAGAAVLSQSRYIGRAAETGTNPDTSPVKKTAVDQVTLGKTGIKLSRLSLGLGTRNGSVQSSLGQEGFNNLIKYAYDQGITGLDTSEGYQTRSMIAEAIKGLPREKLFIQTKVSARGGRGARGGGRGRRGMTASAAPANTIEKIEGFLKELNVDYIDSLLIHCQINPTWDEDSKQLMEDFETAKEKGYIRSHGVSTHSLPATTKAASLDWVNVNLVRINPQGNKIDNEQIVVYGNCDETDVPAVAEQLKIMRKNGHGVIGIKIFGEGDFTQIEERKKSINYVMQSDIVDAVVIGFKSKEEIDEAIKNINEAFEEKA